MKKFNFRVFSMKVDHRQWRNQAVEVAPETDLLVQVEVPETEVTGENVITPKGLRAIVDQFDMVFSDAVSLDFETYEPAKQEKNIPDDGWEIPSE